MNIANVMDELATQLDTIAGLRVYDFPPGSAVPPFAVIGFPDSIDYDATYGRGSDTTTVPVVICVGRASERVAHDQIAAYTDGSGSTSVKTVLEAHTYTSCDSILVRKATFDIYTLGGTDYRAAVFSIDIVGSGS